MEEIESLGHGQGKDDGFAYGTGFFKGNLDRLTLKRKETRTYIGEK